MSNRAILFTCSVFTDHRHHLFVFPYASPSANKRLYTIHKSVLVHMIRDTVCALGTQGTNTIVGESILFIRELYKEKKTGIHGQLEIIRSGHRIIFCFVSPERSCQCAVTSGRARSIV